MSSPVCVYPPVTRCVTADTRSCSPPQDPPPSRLSYVRPNYACDMLRRLDGLRRDRTLVDAVLCVGGGGTEDDDHSYPDVEMPCHRAVLASVSSYFRSMFAGGMRESKQFRVCFSDVLATTLKVGLRCTMVQFSTRFTMYFLFSFCFIGLLELFILLWCSLV